MVEKQGIRQELIRITDALRLLVFPETGILTFALVAAGVLFVLVAVGVTTVLILMEVRCA